MVGDYIHLAVNIKPIYPEFFRLKNLEKSGQYRPRKHGHERFVITSNGWNHPAARWLTTKPFYRPTKKLFP